MGAWGTKSFENDDALDWVYELEKCNDPKIFWDAVESVIHEEYVDSDIATEALAALEVTAAMKGKNTGELPEEVEKWLSENKEIQLPDNFYTRAEEALNKIMGSESELKELWEESDSYKDWLDNMQDLISRINS